MKWIAISGSWRKTNKQVEKEVKEKVKNIFLNGDGIVSGGAPGVDFIATKEALKLDSKAKRIKVFLPTSLDFYIKHLRKRAEEKIISKKQCDTLVRQLTIIHRINSSSIIEGKDVLKNKYVEESQYYGRNSLIISMADELIAFHVNKSFGTLDAIKKADKKGIPVKVFSYAIE